MKMLNKNMGNERNREVIVDINVLTILIKIISDKKYSCKNL